MNANKDPRHADPLTGLQEQAALIAQTRELAQQMTTAERVFLPREMGMLHARWKFMTIGAVLLFVIATAGTQLLRELLVRIPPLWALAGMVAVALPAMLLAVRWWLRRWQQAWEHQQQTDKSHWPGWWLDMRTRQLQPHLQPGQKTIELGNEDFSLGLDWGASRINRYAILELRHPRRGTVAELCTWKMPRTYPSQTNDEAIDKSIALLTQAMATRMGWRCLLPKGLEPE